MRMDLKFWPQAESQLNEIFLQGKAEFGLMVARRLVARILDSMDLLSEQPYAGKIEPYLEGRRVVYRSFVVHRHYKLIYSVDESRSCVNIVAVWDTRRDPRRLHEEIED